MFFVKHLSTHIPSRKLFGAVLCAQSIFVFVILLAVAKKIANIGIPVSVWEWLAGGLVTAFGVQVFGQGARDTVAALPSKRAEKPEDSA